MEIDQSEDENATRSDVLRDLSAKGPLPTYLAKLSGSSHIIPSQKDFHFYNNFQEFKHPVQEIDQKSKKLLDKVGASENLFGKPIPLPDDKDVELDDDVAFDWLVNVNDEIFERFDVSLDEFKTLRKEEEESGVRTMRVSDDGENGFQMVYGKKNKRLVGGLERNVEGEVKGVQEVKVAAKVKPKIPFHVSTIPKPQDEYKIIVNNSNQPFEHVWLQRSEDGSRFLHPLEKLSVLDFVDKSDSISEPVKPLPLDVTPFKFVEEVKDLKQLAIKLRSVDEFAARLDLSYIASNWFKELICYIIADGGSISGSIPCLEGIENGKVQPGTSAESFLWSHSKQRSDIKASIVWSIIGWTTLNFVAQLYKGVQSADLNAQQLAVVSGLCEWRDVVARAEDESTGYVLPNRTLVEIAKQTPLTTSQLRRVLKSKHPYIERNLGSVVSIIRHSIQNAAAFEEASKSLKERRMELLMQANEENTLGLATEETEMLHSEAPEILKNAEEVHNIQSSTSPNGLVVENSAAFIQHKNKYQDNGSFNANDQSDVPRVHGDPKDTHANLSSSHSAEATVQMLKKPSRAFGALFGNSAKRKFNPDITEEKETKLEHIKSTVSLPFHTFSGRDESMQTNAEESAKKLENSHQGDASAPPPATGSSLADIIVLDDDSDVEELEKSNSDDASNDQLKQLENNEAGSDSDFEEEDEPMSLSDLSSSFQKCLPSLDQTISSKVVDKSQPTDGFLQVKPFDYEAARQQVKFGGNPNREPMGEGDDNKRRDRKKGIVTAKSEKDEGTTDLLPQGRRRQAFPASGNRSATFR
ncbi:hypothetical protein DH2020_034667 [Rehmannia glutinosa]|uniref:HRDC domain-containing protein n=1 Tax=Rehmannia glutinosa TaxID=99300 RepID=A0ABR0V9M0_REHGL